MAERREPERVREPLRRIDREHERALAPARRRQRERGCGRRFAHAARAHANEDLPFEQDVDKTRWHVEPRIAYKRSHMKRELVVTADGRDRTVVVEGPDADGLFRVTIDGEVHSVDARAIRRGT